VVFGGVNWFNAIASGAPTPLGTIMLAALPLLLGIQFLLAFLGFDIANVPKRPIHNDLPNTLPKGKDIKNER
jgi:dolichol-phosphate mannosyltransferase